MSKKPFSFTPDDRAKAGRHAPHVEAFHKKVEAAKGPKGKLTAACQTIIDNLKSMCDEEGCTKAHIKEAVEFTEANLGEIVDAILD